MCKNNTFKSDKSMKNGQSSRVCKMWEQTANSDTFPNPFTVGAHHECHPFAMHSSLKTINTSNQYNKKQGKSVKVD